MDTRVDLHPTELSRSHHDREGSLSFLLFEPPYMMAPHGRLTHPPGALIPVPDSGPFLQRQRPDFPHLTDTVLKDHRQKRPSQPHPDTPLTGGRHGVSTRDWPRAVLTASGGPAAGAIVAGVGPGKDRAPARAGLQPPRRRRQAR